MVGPRSVQQPCRSVLVAVRQRAVGQDHGQRARPPLRPGGAGLRPAVPGVRAGGTGGESAAVGLDGGRGVARARARRGMGCGAGLRSVVRGAGRVGCGERTGGGPGDRRGAGRGRGPVGRGRRRRCGGTGRGAVGGRGVVGTEYGPAVRGAGSVHGPAAREIETVHGRAAHGTGAARRHRFVLLPARRRAGRGGAGRGERTGCGAAHTGRSERPAPALRRAVRGTGRPGRGVHPRVHGSVRSSGGVTVHAAVRGHRRGTGLRKRRGTGCGGGPVGRTGQFRRVRTSGEGRSGVPVLAVTGEGCGPLAGRDDHLAGLRPGSGGERLGAHVGSQATQDVAHMLDIGLRHGPSPARDHPQLRDAAQAPVQRCADVGLHGRGALSAALRGEGVQRLLPYLRRTGVHLLPQAVLHRSGAPPGVSRRCLREGVTGGSRGRRGDLVRRRTPLRRWRRVLAATRRSARADVGVQAPQPRHEVAQRVAGVHGTGVQGRAHPVADARPDKGGPAGGPVDQEFTERLGAAGGEEVAALLDEVVARRGGRAGRWADGEVPVARQVGPATACVGTGPVRAGSVLGQVPAVVEQVRPVRRHVRTVL